MGPPMCTALGPLSRFRKAGGPMGPKLHFYRFLNKLKMMTAMSAAGEIKPGLASSSGGHQSSNSASARSSPLLSNSRY